MKDDAWRARDGEAPNPNTMWRSKTKRLAAERKKLAEKEEKRHGKEDQNAAEFGVGYLFEIIYI